MLCIILTSSRFERVPLDSSIGNNENAIFIQYTALVIKAPMDMAGFNGHSIKAMFGDKSTNAILVDESREQGLHSWREIASLIGSSPQVTTNTSPVAAVHVHNEHKIGDLLEKIQRGRDLKGGSGKRQKVRVGVFTREDMMQVIDRTPYPFVMTNSGDENWGFLSTPIGTRTTKWINMTNHLLIHHASHQTVRDFLDCPKLILLLCNTHIDPAIGVHRKVSIFSDIVHNFTLMRFYFFPYFIDEIGALTTSGCEEQGEAFQANARIVEKESTKNEVAHH